MSRIHCFVPLLAAAILSACASYAGRDLIIGVATVPDVVASMGEPAMRWRDADGSLQLAYPRGPEGAHTFMVFVGPDGKVRAIENALVDKYFSRIVPGSTTQDQVLRLIGPPTPQWTAYYAARDELVWEWRYCDGGGLLARFDVLFDGATKLVGTTYSRPDYRGPDGIVPPCGHVYGR